MVLQVPPGVLGILDDAHLRLVNDLGVTGPDQGKGGKYLVVPPGYNGTLPPESEGYFVRRPAPSATSSSCAASSRAATWRPS